MNELHVGTTIGDDIVESITINLIPSDEKMERIKEEVKHEDYTIFIKSYDSGEKFTVGWKFTVIDKDSNKPLQYGDYIRCSGEDLHEALDLIINQCKEAKRMVQSQD